MHKAGGLMARFFGWYYRQAGSETRYYHPSYSHALRLGYNESSNNSSTPPQSPQPTNGAERLPSPVCL
ncbi:hypothetical protein Y032_0286g1399 [Ancylostoma ceylanicum]|uniref:Uncharacterized protein n=1 Tax=Ancylostoma ceylanicum TaxID=53326 RepID=A0A016S6K2_9BILA|nr:hypothetical protein Y032_0286g1399 [Ancylostoma ceylanicum]